MTATTYTGTIHMNEQARLSLMYARTGTTIETRTWHYPNTGRTIFQVRLTSDLGSSTLAEVPTASEANTVVAQAHLLLGKARINRY